MTKHCPYRTAAVHTSLLAAALVGSTTHAAVIAESVADFSSTQGQAGWQYGYYNGTLAPAGFTRMNQFLAIPVASWYEQNGTYWTALDIDGGHPQSADTTGGRVPVNQWAVRRWTSTVAGPVTITGQINDRDASNGNGIIAHIFLNGTEIYTHSIANGDFTGLTYTLPVSLSVGATLDFAIDAGTNDFADSTRFTAVIVPEPSLLAAVAPAMLVLCRRQRRA